MTREDEYIITIAWGSEYGVWKEGGYWKIHVKKRDWFVAGLLVQGEGKTIIKEQSITFDKITDISQFEGKRVKLYEKAPEQGQGHLFFTLMVGSETSVVKSYRKK